MTEVLGDALQAGQVTPMDGGAFWCEACERSYPSKASVKAHLNTKKHSDNLLTHSPPTKTNPRDDQRQSRAGYSEEGQQAKVTDWNNGNSHAPRTTVGAGSTDEEVLGDALQAGQVTPMDGGAFWCEACERRYPSKASVKAHLNTKKHSDNEVKDTSECESPQDERAAALQADDVTPRDGGGFWCTVCDRNYSSKASIKAHLNTKKHNENLLTHSPPKTNFGDDQRHSRVGCSEEGQQAKATDWNNENSHTIYTTFGAGSLDENVNDTSEYESLQEELAAALQAGEITSKDGGAFWCEACERNYSSKASVKAHLNTKKHSDNLQSFRGKAPSADGKPLTPRDRAHCLPLGTEVPPGRTELSPRRTNDAEASTRVTWPTQIMKSNLEYPYNKHLAPGRVYVFNYIYFHHNTRQTVEDRMGAKMDSKNLEETFTKLGYEVRLYEDLTAEKTMKEVEAIKEDPSLEATQACFFFFLSHGTNSKEFLAADGKRLNLDNLRQEFTNERCPALARKPRIFMTNYCRGNNEERVQTDGLVSVPRDMVTIYANTDGVAAYRLPGEGTCFVLSLCHVLQGLKKRTKLRHVYLLLGDEMHRRKATSPTWEDIGFKDFYLEMPSTFKKDE